MTTTNEATQRDELAEIIDRHRTPGNAVGGGCK